MKKLVLCLLTISFIQIALGKSDEKVNSLEFLKGENRINVVLDYSEAMMAGMNFEDFKKYLPEHYDDGWDDHYAAYFLDRFYIGFNNKMMDSKKVNMLVGNYSSANYKIVVKVYLVDRKGNTNADIIISPISSDEVLYKSDYMVDGGTFGTVPNLMGDGMRTLGRTLATRIIKELK